MKFGFGLESDHQVKFAFLLVLFSLKEIILI